MSKNVVTKEVRFSYLHLFEPHAVNPEEVAKYAATLLIPKKVGGVTNPDIARIEAAIKAAYTEGVSSKFGGTAPKVWKNPLRDGDEEREGAEFQGHYFINAKSSRRPHVLDEDNQPAQDKTDFYSGMYGRASVTFYPFAGKAKGVACGLEAVRKLRDGEPLGGGGVSAASAAAAFADSADDLL